MSFLDIFRRKQRLAPIVTEINQVQYKITSDWYTLQIAPITPVLVYLQKVDPYTREVFLYLKELGSESTPQWHRNSNALFHSHGFVLPTYEQAHAYLTKFHIDSINFHNGFVADHTWLSKIQAVL